MKKSGGIVHGVGVCEDCGWESCSYKNILGISAIHAKTYGHKVNVELGSYITFDGR